jgi:putative oxidoreductase
MGIIALLGRILFSVIFIRSGINHFTKVSMMAQYTASKGVPAARFMVQFTGVMAFVGGVSVLLGAYARLGALLLVLFLIPTAMLMHNYWTIKDPMARGNDQAHFIKDISMAGGAMMIWYFGSGPFSLIP